MMEQTPGPIGIFDSGFGGLSVFKEIRKKLPQYDYLYLGDNQRTPYGTRTFETVYRYTKECIEYLFSRNCSLVILACNTASAKALRTIQQQDLPKYRSIRKVLGVIRPTAEIIGPFSRTKHIGVLATPGTTASKSYDIEIKKFYPDVQVFQEACPMWVPLVENNEHESEGADYFIKKNIQNLFNKSNDIDTIVLGCTHYPLLMDKIQQFIPSNVTIIAQGEIVAESLVSYLQNHPEVEKLCSKGGSQLFYTTGSTDAFDEQAGVFLEEKVKSAFCNLEERSKSQNIPLDRGM